MDPSIIQSRLSRISTMWTMLGRAQQSPEDAGHAALAAVVQRYQGAVYRYLLGAVRDANVADELFQEFALRLIQGRYRHADPTRGRFRDYLRTSLCHLVNDYQKEHGREPLALDTALVQPAAPEEPSPTSAAEFDAHWREELLARAWAGLEAAEKAGGQPLYTVLKQKAENPGLSSGELAARLSQMLGKPFSDTAYRKALQRARSDFARRLIDDVCHSLQHPSDEALEQELIDLDLLPYCRSALAERRQQAKPGEES